MIELNHSPIPRNYLSDSDYDEDKNFEIKTDSLFLNQSA
jgi:hypothetical protein